jgi:hypothetical protein
MNEGGDMTSKLRFSWRLVGSLVLGGMTWGVLALGEAKLPYSHILANITEAGIFPALLIAGMFYPEGAHTGRGVPYFGYVLLGAGILFYTLVWLVILSWFNRRGWRVANPSARQE